MSSNPFKPGSYEHRIWQQGADSTNEKWRLAIIGKLPDSLPGGSSVDQWFDSREVAPRPWEVDGRIIGAVPPISRAGEPK